MVLQDVLHVLKLNGNLLLVSHFAKHGAEVQFLREGCSILDQHKQVACEGDLCGNLYIMHITTTTLLKSAHIVVLDCFPAEGKDSPKTALLTDHSRSRATIDTWHCWLGHLNTDDIVHMVHKGMTQGMEIIGGNKPSTSICKPCIKGKQTCAKICKETNTCTDLVLGRVFSNVYIKCGAGASAHEFEIKKRK